MTNKVISKWRPTLGMIVSAVLMTVLALPLVSLFFFRLYENELLRQTEAELIAQSAALAAIFGQEVEAAPDTSLLSAPLVDPAISDHIGSDGFIQPTLDLTSDQVLGPRPKAAPATMPPAAALMAIGQRLQSILQRTQSVTLAGFRLLDSQGVVIAGRHEVGLSLDHIEEVKQALHGRYKAVLRARISDEPPPPLYSLSRGTSVRIFAAMPVVVQNRVAGVIYASRTPSNIIKHIYEQQRKLVLAGLSVLGATLIIGFIFSRAITKPIHSLVARTIDIGHGKREALQPLAHHGTREIAILSQSFSDMAQRLHDRSDYITTFAAHVTHELKTPLTSIQGAAELLRDEAAAASGSMTSSDQIRFLDNIIADTSRLTLMLRRLRELARAENPTIAGQTVISAAVTQLISKFADLNIQAEAAIDCRVSMSAENLSIVLSHLADNSIRHNASTLWISAVASNQIVVITVRDDGEGISEANRARIFEAFFTTRREAGGTGMGLGIVQAMLQAHNGSIGLLPSQKGATFEIRLPEA